MFKNVRPFYFAYAFVAAIAYSITLFFFLEDTTYSRIWLLGVGNMLFLFFIAAFLITMNSREKKNAGSMKMLKEGHVVTLMGTILALIIGIILLLLFIPDLFQSGTPSTVLKNAPANTVHGKTNGLVFKVILDILIGNIVSGAFASIIFPFTLKGDQTKEE